MKQFFLLIALCVATGSLFGQQWGFTSTPRQRDINAIKIFDRNSILAVGGNLVNDSIEGICKSDNGGLSWDGPFTDVISSWLKSVEFKDSANGIAVGTNGKIKKTDDRGNTWTYLSSPLDRDYNKVVFPNVSTTIIVGGKNAQHMQTVLKSTNNGQSWNVVHDQSGYWLHAVYFINATNGFAVGDSGTILKTTNGGDNWTPVTPPLYRNFKAIAFTDASKGIIAGGSTTDSMRTILRTIDGGNNWTIVLDEPGGILNDVSFLTADTGFIAGDKATVMKTINAGLSWQMQTIDGSIPSEIFNTIRFFAQDFGIVAGRFGNVHVFSAALPPVAFTTGFDVIDSTQVKLIGSVNTFDYPAQYSFIWSADSLFSSVSITNSTNIQSNSLVPAVFIINGLTPNTRYYFYIRVKTFGGFAFGDTMTVYTGTAPTSLLTLPAGGVTNTAATLNGVVNGFSNPVSLVFEYGTTPSLGQQVTASPATVTDTALHLITANLSSLTPQTLYYFRLKGSVSGVDNVGSILNFYTGKPYTSLLTLPASDISDSTATLNGIVSGFDVPATLSFDYSPNFPNFSQHAIAGISAIGDTVTYQTSALLTNLTSAILYYARFRAETFLGTFYGDTILFYTGFSQGNLQTLTSTFVTSSSAKLNATIQKFDVPVTLSFEYGATTALGSSIAASTPSVSDTLLHKLTTDISGLQANKLYYYRIKAQGTGGGVLYGNIKQVFTGNTIPNWDFENWHTDTITNPTPWIILGDGVTRVPGHSGNYGLRLVEDAIAIFGKLLVGNDGPVFFGGSPISFRPDSIIGYFNYDITPGDTMLMLTQMTKNGAMVVYEFSKFAGNSGGAFKRLAFPIHYQSGAVPDSIVVGFITTNAFGNPVPHNNSVVIDDISFSPATQNIINPGFEDWLTYTQRAPDGWWFFRNLDYDYHANGMPPIVTQDYYSFPDDLAVALNTRDMDGHGRYFDGNLSTKHGVFNENAPSFPVLERHKTLNGYYKFYPVNGDSMDVNVALFKNGQYVGQGQFFAFDTVDQFTPFEIDIFYMDTAAVPDSAVIGVRTAQKRGVMGLSHTVVDKLSFDGFAAGDFISDIGEVNVTGNLLSAVKIFPNPTSSSVTIQLQNQTEGTLCIYNLAGALLFTQKITSPSTTVDVSNLVNGLYLVKATTPSGEMFGKMTVLK